MLHQKNKEALQDKQLKDKNRAIAKRENEREMLRKKQQNMQVNSYEPEGDQLDEKSIQMQRRVDRYLGRDKAKAKERLSRQNDRKDKKAALAAMEKQYKGMKSGIYSSYEPEGEMVDEKINMKKADMGDVVKDFYKSKAPQFKGKSKEKRRQMAIAAKLTAERGGKRLGEQQQQQEPGQRKMISNMTQLQMKKQQMDRRKLQMKKRGEIPINTESVES